MVRHVSCRLTDNRWITPPQEEAIVTFNVTPPTSGQMYDAFTGNAVANLAAAGEIQNVRLIQVVVDVTWTVQPSPLEIHMTLDNLANVTASQVNPASGTDYILYKTSVGNVLAFSTSTAIYLYRPFLIEGRSLRMTVETTGGTVSSLRWWINYATWPL